MTGRHDDAATTTTATPKTLHIAPMMDVSTREFRQLMRILSKRAVLWTEMVVDSTIIFAKDVDFHLEFERDNSHPIICQIGGNNRDWIHQGTSTILDYGYDEVNLNMGCPSNRVEGEQKFGAILMKHVDVAETTIQAMVEASQEHAAKVKLKASHNQVVAKRISVKCRVGVDEHDTMYDLVALIRRLSHHCKVFYLHARKAVLGGLLSPAQNRLLPPLNYPRVYEICKIFPDYDFYLNGGIKSLKDAKELCHGREMRPGQFDDEQNHGVLPCQACNFSNGSCVAPPPCVAPPNLRGCLLGRVAIDNPCILWDVDRYFYGEDENPCRTRREVLDKYCCYLESVYPRRCCDQDTFVTSRITDAKEFCFDYSYCSICAPLCVGEEDRGSVSIAPPDYGKDQGKKITSHILNRSVKPILNIFFGLPTATLFRQECHNLVRNDCDVRNCGPGALIRRALLIIPGELLDQDLTPAEQHQARYM